MAPNSMNRPIIVVTGANGGVGLGVCERILVQLSSPTPPDSRLLRNGSKDAVGTPFHAGNGCTLVLACRNQKKAREAKDRLLGFLDRIRHADEAVLESGETPSRWPDAQDLIPADRDPVASGVASPEDEMAIRHRKRFVEARSASIEERDGYARLKYRASFCAGTTIDIVPLDLGSLESTQECIRTLRNEYPYLTHLILNAGGARFTGVNWLLATWSVLTNLHKAVTRPTYKLQRAGDRSEDGYGWVWQLNVGAHYLMCKELRQQLRNSPYNVPSRIIWTGSLEADIHDYHPEDFQCLDQRISPRPYESTKYQCELAALGMDDVLRHSSAKHEPRAYTAHPGIVASSIFSGVIHAWLLSLMKIVFYIARWTFSPHHPITAYKGAAAASFVSVAPPQYLDPQVRYGTRCNIQGGEYVFPGRLDGWVDAPAEPGELPDNAVSHLAKDMIRRYDALMAQGFTKPLPGTPDVPPVPPPKT